MILQEEPLSGRVEYLLVHCVHLLTLDQIDDVKVPGQLLLASTERLAAPLGFREALRASVLTAAEEIATKKIKSSVRSGEDELFAVHDQLVEEVKLLSLRLLTDVGSPNPMLDELFHLVFVEEQLIDQVLRSLYHRAQVLRRLPFQWRFSC